MQKKTENSNGASTFTKEKVLFILNWQITVKIFMRIPFISAQASFNFVAGMRSSATFIVTRAEREEGDLASAVNFSRLGIVGLNPFRFLREKIDAVRRFVRKKKAKRR